MPVCPALKGAYGRISLAAKLACVFVLLVLCFSAVKNSPHPSAPAVPRKKPQLRIIAFFFPQFHPIPENDEFWGPGFTEWTNLQNSFWNAQYFRPIKHPTELGYYNLLDFEVRKAQGLLAKEYGVWGFCYHHYWFSGRPVMPGVLQALLRDGEPNLPFCLNWANEPWTRRWDGGDNAVLLAQDYGNESDWTAHFDWLLPFFFHRNYIRVGGKPMLLIYRVGHMKKAEEIVAHWQHLARRAGFPGLHLLQCLGNFPDSRYPAPFVSGAVEFQPNYWGRFTDLMHQTSRVHPIHYRGSFVSWDNSPRHHSDPARASVLLADHPDTFRVRLQRNLIAARRDPNHDTEDFFFLNAWNEWGEGNALEPSDQYGRGYLEALRSALQRSADLVSARPSPSTKVLSKLMESAEYCKLEFDFSFYRDVNSDIPQQRDKNRLLGHFLREGFESGRFFRFSLTSNRTQPYCRQFLRSLSKEIVATDLDQLYPTAFDVHGAVCILAGVTRSTVNDVAPFVRMLSGLRYPFWHALLVILDNTPAGLVDDRIRLGGGKGARSIELGSRSPLWAISQCGVHLWGVEWLLMTHLRASYPTQVFDQLDLNADQVAITTTVTPLRDPSAELCRFLCNINAAGEASALGTTVQRYGTMLRAQAPPAEGTSFQRLSYGCACHN